MSRNSIQSTAISSLVIGAIVVTTSLSGCNSPKQVKPALLEVWKASKVSIPNRFETALNRGFFVGKSPIVASQDVSSADFGTEQLGHRTLTIVFRPEASKKMQEALRDWQDFVVVTLNGRVVESFKLYDPFIADRLTILLPDPLAEGEREALEALGKK